jgi:hypothetical protein
MIIYVCNSYNTLRYTPKLAVRLAEKDREEEEATGTCCHACRANGEKDNQDPRAPFRDPSAPYVHFGSYIGIPAPSADFLPGWKTLTYGGRSVA